jgi:uridylate kinase
MDAMTTGRAEGVGGLTVEARAEGVGGPVANGHAEGLGVPVGNGHVEAVGVLEDDDRPSVAGPMATARRVVLKLSGESFGGGMVGVDPDIVVSLAKQIAAVVRRGMQVAVVVGGGNFFRGAELQERGMDRGRADYMGMLGTVMNCLALQDFLEKEGIDTRVQTAISMAQVAEPYIPRRAIRHLEKGRVVIFGAGAGMPYFTTDTVAAQRALEINADVVLMSKNGVDGVYTADPRTDPTARKLDSVTFDEALRRGLKVVDAAAFSLCQDNRLPMLVFGAEGEDTIARAVAGDPIGTLITA